MNRKRFVLLTAFMLIISLSNSIATAEQCLGDLNKDGQVGSVDLANFAANFGGSLCRVNCIGDFDYDGDDDGANLSTFIQNFGKTGCTNTLPISNAGPSYRVTIGDLATLDGSGSFDFNGDPLTYLWAFLAVPTGSAATLSDASGLSPSFTADKAGNYWLELIVNDGTGDSAADIAFISAISKPIAATETKIMAGDVWGRNRFGSSVSISGNYAIVGAKHDADNGIESGAAYVFMLEGDTWIQQAKLKASDGAEYDYFGTSVAIHEDLAVIGAYGDDDQSGAAYIFKRDGATWVEQSKLVVGDAELENYFGVSVAIHGDLAVVGADGDDDMGDESGSTYVFKREGSEWIQQAKLTACDGDRFDEFGRSVAVNDDYVIVGSIFDDCREIIGGPVCDAEFKIIGGSDDRDQNWDCGSVYIFKRQGSDWIPQVKLKASDAAESDLFGLSVAISGDYIIVGADNNVWDRDAGKAYIFKREGTSWIEQTKIVASDAALNDWFGYSVDLDGDVAVVGAYGNQDRGIYTGSAYVFKRMGSGWIEQGKINAGDADSRDYYGMSVAISGDYSIVGAPDWSIGDYPGAAYIYHLHYLSPVERCEELMTTVKSLALPQNTETSLKTDLESAIKEIEGGNTQAAIVRIGDFVNKVEVERGQNIRNEDADALISEAQVIIHAITTTVSVSADRKTIQRGESSTLRWTSRNADSCAIEPGLGTVTLSGSAMISPLQTTDYVITATGIGGSASAAVTILVVQPAPTVSISVDPAIIKSGRTATLSWQTSEADSVEIDPGVGSVATSGSLEISPSETATFTITAAGPGGTASAKVTLKVRPLIKTRMRYEYDAVGRIKSVIREQLP